jgi:hypothetical protein
MIEKTYKQIETIEFEPKRNKILERQTDAKSFKSWLESSITLLRIDKRYEEEQLLKTILKKYLEFEPIKEIKLSKVQSESTFRILNENPEIIIIETYQNKKPIKTELLRKESEWIMSFLKEHKQSKINPNIIREKWNSIDLALIFSKYWGYKPITKENYYSDRFFQNYWTIHLRYLREIDLINYKGGIISLK